MVKNEELREQGAFSRRVSRYVAGMLQEKDVRQVALGKALKRSQSYVSVRWNGRESWSLDELDVIAKLVGFEDGIDLMMEIGARVRRADERDAARRDDLARLREARANRKPPTERDFETGEAAALREDTGDDV